MKRLFFATSVFSFLFFASCDQSATFNAAQPEAGEQLTAFPANMKGFYFSADKESILTVSDSLVLRIYDFDMKLNKDSLPDGFKLTGDTLSIFDFGGYNEKQKVSFLDKSTFVYHEHFGDTLFKLSEFEVLKKYKGYIFLNERVQTDSNKFEWEVRKIGMNKGLLTMDFVDEKKQIDKLVELPASLSEDPTTYPYTPNHNKFKEFMEDDGFEKVDSFYKVKISDGVIKD